MRPPPAPPRKVLLVSRSLPCHIHGGLEFHVLDQAAGLARSGVEVHLLSTPVPNETQSELDAMGIRMHAVADTPPGKYSTAYFRKVGPAIRSLHRQHKFDIIHAHEFGFGFCRFDESLAGATITLTVHGTITTETPLHADVFRRLSPKEKWRAVTRFGRRYLFAPAWHRSLEAAQVLLVDSDFIRRELTRIRPRLADKIILVPLSMSLERYPEIDHAQARSVLGWPEAGKSPVLITVGRLEWQKGHDVALRALAELRELDWLYVIIGAGRAEPELRRLAANLQITRQVQFLGQVPNDLKVRALAGADLFIWPERTHPAFGLAGLEALIMGTPVVATRQGAIPEIIGTDNGALFDSDDPRALADALKRTLADPWMISRWRQDLRKRTLEKVRPERMIEATLAAYDQALAH